MIDRESEFEKFHQELSEMSSPVLFAIIYEPELSIRNAACRILSNRGEMQLIEAVGVPLDHICTQQLPFLEWINEQRNVGKQSEKPE
jgi:hypothetical protein